MNALLVIDMQEEYIRPAGNKKNGPYDAVALLRAVNAKIRQYAGGGDAVLYIKNRFFWQTSFSGLVPGLEVVSDFIFEKKKASCFSNPLLLRFLEERDIRTIELVGVDGNYCVGKSALDGIHRGLCVRFSQTGVGIADNAKFLKMKRKLLHAEVQISEA